MKQSSNETYPRGGCSVRQQCKCICLIEMDFLWYAEVLCYALRTAVGHINRSVEFKLVQSLTLDLHK